MVTRVQKLIGKSFQNRNIYLYEFFVEKPKFNVLLTGSVHGIEKQGGDSLNLLMNDIETGDPNFYKDINIAVLPYWNVDGLANGTYQNAQNFSINYSALNVVTLEQRALWEYLWNNQYYPDFYIDNHNIDHWARGATYYMYDHVPRLSLLEDLLIGINLSDMQRHKMTWAEYTDIVNYVQTKAGSTYKYNKFWELNDYQNLKYNTYYDIAETQQFMAQRFDALSFLIEGVAPADDADSNPLWNKIITSQFLANKYMIDWARNHPQLCNSTKSAPPRVGDYVPINTNIVWDLFATRFATNNDTNNTVYYEWSTYTAWLYTQTNTPQPSDTGIGNGSEWTTAPLGYAVHQTNEENLNDYLQYLGYQWTQGTSQDSFDTEQFHCTAADAWDDQEGDIPYQFPQANRAGYYTSASRTDFSDYALYYVDQMGSLSLINILEPMSEANMAAYLTLFPTLELVPDDDFPIIRLISRN